MGNHCVEIECHECGYYECQRCSDSGISSIPSGPNHERYLKDKAEEKLNNYEICFNCGMKAMN